MDLQLQLISLYLFICNHQLAHYLEQTTLFINPIIYAEISMRFSHNEHVARALLSLEAAFLAGKVFMSYKKWRKWR